MHKLLSGIDGVTALEPQGAFYAFPNLSATSAGRSAVARRRPPPSWRRPARRGQGGDRPRRGVRRARLRPPQLRPGRRRPRRGLPPHRRPARRGASRARATPALRLVADADHERARRPVGAPAHRRARRRRRRLVVGEPAGGGRPHRGPAPGADGAVDEVLAAPCERPHRRCTSTAAARGGCARACSGSPTGPTSASTGSSPGDDDRSRSRPSRRAAGAALRRRRPQPRRRACSACGRSTTPTAARPQQDRPPRRPRPVRARGARRGPRLRVRPAVAPRRCVLLLARVGPPGHAVGRDPAGGRRGRRPAPVVAGGDQRESICQPRGRRTDRSGSSATAPASGASTAGRPGRAPGRWSTSARTSACRSGCSASRASPSSPTGGSPSSSETAGDHLAVRDPDGGRVTTRRLPHTVFDQLRAPGDRRRLRRRSRHRRAARRRRSTLDDRRRSTCSSRPATSASTPLVLGAGAHRVPDRRRRRPPTPCSTGPPTRTSIRRGRASAAARADPRRTHRGGSADAQLARSTGRAAASRSST